MTIIGEIGDRFASWFLSLAGLSETVYRKGLPFGTFLNVNIPNCPLNDIAGVRISRQAVAVLSEYVEKREDPRNRTYFWQGRDMQSFESDPQLDGVVLKDHYISITPIQCDMTDYSMLDDLKGWELDKIVKSRSNDSGN